MISVRTLSLLSWENVVVSELAIDFVSGAGKNVVILIKIAHQLSDFVLVLTLYKFNVKVTQKRLFTSFFLSLDLTLKSRCGFLSN